MRNIENGRTYLDSQSRTPSGSATGDLNAINGTWVSPQGLTPLTVVQITCAADIKPEAIRWLWNGWLARGKFHVFAGQAGTGKTTIAIALAATISMGGRFPDGTQAPVGNVLIWSGEDSPQDTLVPRLLAAGADILRVHFIDGVSYGKHVRSFDPATDIGALKDAVRCIGDISLLIVDPVVNAVAGDSHKNGEVRRALQPLVDFGEEFGCAVLGITHFSKGTGGKDPMERVTGSLAFAALARVVLATGKKNDGGIVSHVFCRAKSNIGPDSGGFEYDLHQKELADHKGIFTSYAAWGKAMEGSARELLQEPDNRESNEQGNTALDDAKDFLMELLEDGELPQKQIEIDAKAAGHSMRTVRRAKDALNIRSISCNKCWYWMSPDNMSKNTKDVQHVHINNLDTLDTLPKSE